MLHWRNYLWILADMIFLDRILWPYGTSRFCTPLSSIPLILLYARWCQQQRSPVCLIRLQTRAWCLKPKFLGPAVGQLCPAWRPQSLELGKLFPLFFKSLIEVLYLGSFCGWILANEKIRFLCFGSDICRSDVLQVCYLWNSRKGVSKVWSKGQIQPTTCFCK